MDQGFYVATDTGEPVASYMETDPADCAHLPRPTLPAVLHSAHSIGFGPCSMCSDSAPPHNLKFTGLTQNLSQV